MVFRSGVGFLCIPRTSTDHGQITVGDYQYYSLAMFVLKRFSLVACVDMYYS